MSDFNDIGISSKLDFPRIKKLLAIGVLASIMHLVGDFLLGFGVEDETKVGLIRMFSAYVGASDGKILAAAILGLVGMTLEGLSMFGVYRLMAEKSPKCAHSYRSGIFGYLIFGVCGFHVPVCAMTFLLKHGVQSDLVLKYAAYFVLPAFALFWVFFLVGQVTQIVAFVRGYTPYRKAACVFSMPTGMIIALIVGLCGNYAFTNAMSCAWIAFGSLWMFAGLLITLKKAEQNYGAENA